MALTDAQKRAQAKYKKANVTQKVVTFGVNERDLLEHVQAQPNQAGYIKRLIREDMERQGLANPESN